MGDSDQKTEVHVRRQIWREGPFDLALVSVLIPLIVIPYTLVELHGIPSLRVITLWFLVKTLAMLTLFALIVFTNFVVVKLKRKNLNLLEAGFIGGIYGSLVGAFVYYFSKFLQIQLPFETLPRRVISTVVIMAGWLPLGVLLSSALNKVKDLGYLEQGKTQATIRERLQSTSKFKNLMRVENLRIVWELTKITDAMAIRVQALSKNSQASLENIQELENILSADSVREFSKMIEQNPTAKNSHTFLDGIRQFRIYLVTIISSAYSSMKVNTLNPGVVSYVVSICVVGIEIRGRKSILEGSLILLVIIFLTFLSYQLSARAKKQDSQIFLPLTFMLISLNILLSSLFYDFLVTKNRIAPTFGVVSKFTSLYALLIFGTYILGHIGSSGITSTENLFSYRKFSKMIQQVEMELLNQQRYLVDHRWAVHIHGKIQTRISSAVLAIKQAAERKDAHAVQSALEAVMHTLKYPVDGFLNPSRTLEDEIHSRLQPWEGLLESELILPSKLSGLTGPTVNVIGEVVEEVISNAVRHGGANALRLELWIRDPSAIYLRTEDNSIVAPSDGSTRVPGLGTVIFDSASLGRWRLSRDKKRAKTVFKIQISTRTNFDFLS